MKTLLMVLMAGALLTGCEKHHNNDASQYSGTGFLRPGGDVQTDK